MVMGVGVPVPALAPALGITKAVLDGGRKVCMLLVFE
jgi:hypothetical protein